MRTNRALGFLCGLMLMPIVVGVGLLVIGLGLVLPLMLLVRPESEWSL